MTCFLFPLCEFRPGKKKYVYNEVSVLREMALLIKCQRQIDSANYSPVLLNLCKRSLKYKARIPLENIDKVFSSSVSCTHRDLSAGNQPNFM